MITGPSDTTLFVSGWFRVPTLHHGPFLYIPLYQSHSNLSPIQRNNPMLCRTLPQLTVPTPFKGLAPELRGQIKACKKLLIIGGGGGVGSWAIQIGSKLCGLEVTATASHPESQAWCSRLGAHSVIDHSQVPTLPLSSFDYILSLSDSIDIAGLARIIKPFGKVSHRFPRYRRDLERNHQK